MTDQQAHRGRWNALYVPAAVRKGLDTAPALPGRWPLAGAVLFTDIAGFSRLTRRYADTGPEGAEQLSQLLDLYFGRMTDTALAHGGDVIDFIGDAIVVLWPAGTDMAGAVGRAAACGLALQASLRQVMTASGLPMQQRVAISAGELALCRVGAAHWTWLLAGRPMLEAAGSYHAAEPGDVILCPPAWDPVRDRVEAETLPDGFALLRKLRPADAAAPTAAVDWDERLEACLPRLRRSAIEARPWAGEFRQISTLFIGLSGIDPQQGTGLDQLQAAVTTVQDQLGRFGGSFERLSMDDKGISALAAFGLPGMAQENDGERALRAALAIHEHLDEAGITSSIGVTRGRAFYADSGGEQRRHFALVGDVINRAARLMVAHPDAVVCDAASRAAALQSMRFDVAEPLVLAGEDRPVAVYLPREPLERRSLQPAGEMADRLQERQYLHERLLQLLQGQGGCALISGEPGIGKSRLLAEAIRLARTDGVRIFECAGAAIEASTPYYPLRRLTSELLLGQSQADLPALRGALPAAFEGEPLLASWTPLFNDILPLGLAETEATETMHGNSRAVALQSLLRHLLARAAAQAPMLLVIDDLHWFDEASTALVGTLLADPPAEPLFVLAGCRPPAQATAAVAEVLAELGDRTLALDTLPREDMGTLIGLKLGVRETDPELTEFVFARTGGHALYSEELIVALSSAGLVECDGHRARPGPRFGKDELATLPDTLEGVIVAHVDRLPEDAQELLKAASVVGREVPEALLRALLAIDHERFDPALEAAVAEDLLCPEGDGEPLYAFRHAVLREVIYGLLPFAQRRDLHARIARWIETVRRDNLEMHAAELAHQWELAGEVTAALTHYEVAAGRALHQFALQEALNHLHKCWSLAEAHGIHVPTARAAHWEALQGHARRELFEPDAATRHYRRSLKLMGERVPRRQPGVSLALLLEVAAHLLQRAAGLRKRIVSSPDPHRRRVAGMHHALAEDAYFNNRPLDTLYHELAAVNCGERCGSVSDIAMGYGTLAVGLGQAGLRRVARHYHRLSLDTAERQKDRYSTADAHLMGALFAVNEARWDEALASCHKAAPIFEDLGAWVRWQQIHALIYTPALIRGLIATAGAEIAASREALPARGVSATVQSWLNAAELQLRLLRDEPTAQLIERVEEIRSGKGLVRGDRLRCLGLTALAWWRLDEPDRALAAADEAWPYLAQDAPQAYWLGDGIAALVEVLLLSWQREARIGRAGTTGHRVAEACRHFRSFARKIPIFRARAALLEGRYQQAAGDIDTATRCWQHALHAATRRQMPLDEALALQELSRCDTEEARTKHQRAQQLFAELGADHYRI